jgi:hypothetical protein
MNILERMPGQRVQTGRLSNTLLEPFAVGDYSEVTLEPEENRLSVRNELRRVAERDGGYAADLRTPRDRGYLCFQLVAG